MKSKIKRKLLNKIFYISSKIYYRFFISKKFYNINKFFNDLTLHGIGILNYKNNKISGEEFFLKKILFNKDKYTVFDIGGNKGEYSKLIKNINHNIKLYSFEPHPKTFLILKKTAQENNFFAFNFGFSDQDGKIKIFDYKKNDGSEHASIYREVITNIHKKEALSHEINIYKIDTFLEKNKIDKINLLKIDTEGNEFKILKGAKKSLNNNIIDIIHFEFNEMNVISRVFFKDFYNLLHNFHFYRMLPDGLIKIEEYIPLNCEIFAFQNIVAVRKDILINL